MFSTHAAGHCSTDAKHPIDSTVKQHRRFVPRTNPRLYVIAFSLALNIGFCTYMAFQWLVPPSSYKTPAERMHIYSQYLPQGAQAEYRERINEKLSTLLEIHKQVHAERQAIADLLAQDSLDKTALNAHFQTIRDLNQSVTRVYQETLVDVEATLPADERMKSHSLIASFLKRDQSAQ